MGFLDFPKLDLYEIHSGARQAYDCGKEIWTPWISWPNKPCNDSSLLPLLIRRLMENWIITISTPRLAGKHDSDALIEKSCSTHGACVRRVMNQESFWPCSSLIRSGEKKMREVMKRAQRENQSRFCGSLEIEAMENWLPLALTTCANRIKEGEVNRNECSFNDRPASSFFFSPSQPEPIWWLWHSRAARMNHNSFSSSTNAAAA
jgi:hypothetical protein